MQKFKFIGLLLSLIISSYALANERIVSIDGSITEIIYALGAQKDLVGVDTTSRYPQAASKLPQVGYMRQLAVEGILSLRPTKVFATTSAGPEEVFDKLKAAKVEVIRIDNQYSLKGVLTKIKQIGKALNKKPEADALVNQLNAKFEHLLSAIKEKKSQPKVLFILGAGERGLMAAGRDTQAQAMLDVVGAKNVMQHKGYKPVGAEGVLQSDPEFILIAHTGPTDMAAVNKKFAMTRAEQNKQIHTIDTIKVLGFGPRIDQGIEQLLIALYPNTPNKDKTP